ncbi:MAG: ORF6N domain-containing protein [Verrucomicrobia bacterium]|nr:ORF6N domain-containing protein [Verrucomicrobiota bacterium]
MKQSPPILAVERVEPFLHVLRGERIILDVDLARIYGVPTKRLNEQVKRNAERFPLDFAFRLTKAEAGTLPRSRSQIATLNRGQNIKSVESRDVAKEGTRRNNLAATLRKLRRFDEARPEIRRAIECNAQFGHASEPWSSWAILAAIETDAGNPAAAAKAKGKAIACYLAYRRDGGENHSGPGRICFDVTQSLLAGNPAQAASLLQQLAEDPECPDWLHTFIRALQAIVSGRRERTLADSPELDHSMATEILFLIETLEKPR